MGLAERRALKNFQDHHLPNISEELHRVAGTDFTLDIKWDTLVIEDQADNFVEFWTKVYFTPLLEALRSVARDDMGKEALANGLKQIIIQNTTGTYYGDRWAKFHNGVLILDHLPNSNIDAIQERIDGLVKVLEKGL
jgi:hypothetical protein